jgi:hypothetical protein
MTNSNETNGNRTRDLPACSAVSQPTAPPRAPNCFIYHTDMAAAYLSMLVLSIINEEQACETL